MRAIVLFVLVLGFTTVEGQNVVEQLDNKYVPPSGSVFDLEDKPGNTGGVATYNNVVKMDIGMLTRGVIAVEYERHLLNGLSADIGAGVTVFPDYVVYVRLDGFDELNLPSPSIEDDYGPYLRGGLKYAFDGFLNSGYMGGAVQYYRHDLTTELSKQSSFQSASANYEQQAFEFRLSFGYQFEVGYNGFLEINTGVGGRIVDTYVVKTIDVTLPNQFGQVGVYEDEVLRASSAEHAFVFFGLKWGFGF